MRRLASLAALLLLGTLLPFAGAQSLVPKTSMTVMPELCEVAPSGGDAQAVFDGSVSVEGMPYVRYRVNLTVVCGGWAATCNPATLTITGNGTQKFSATVIVPQGSEGGLSLQVNFSAIVTTPGLQVTCETYAMVVVKQSFGVDVQSDAASLNVDAGKTVKWPFRVRNTGNGDDSYSISIINLKTYTDAGWTFRFNRTIVSAGPLVSVPIELSITPPENGKNQTMDIEVNAYSMRAKSHNQTLQDRTLVSVIVRAVPGGGGGGGGGSGGNNKKTIPGFDGAVLLAIIGCVAISCNSRRRPWP